MFLLPFIDSWYEVVGLGCAYLVLLLPEIYYTYILSLISPLSFWCFLEFYFFSPVKM